MSVRVFLAEDHDDLAELVARALKQRGWSVTRARTASEAGPRLRGDRFDAVILDYKLPDGNGLDLLGIVRESSPSTPVLFLTAHGNEDVALQALGLGASDYMQKTGTLLADLPSRVEALLARESDIRRASAVVTVPVKEAHPSSASESDPSSRILAAEEGQKLLREFVKGEVIGAAFFDGAGEPIAALLPSSLEPRALGLALVQVHAQAVLMGRTTHLAPRAYTFTLDTSDGVLAATGVTGRALVCVLLQGGSARPTEKLEALASRVR